MAKKEQTQNPENQEAPKTASAQPEQAEAAAAEAPPADAACEATETEGDVDPEADLREYHALEESLHAAEAAQEDAEAKLLRLQADFDNFRRRQRQENEDLVKRAAAGLAESLLPVLDNFERALASMGDSPEKEGVAMIAKQMFTVLTQAGLQEIDALGQPFDPTVHQAVGQVQTEKEEEKGMVLTVLQRGYTFGGKLLRAAMVQVGC